MNGLVLQVQEALQRDPFAGDLFVFRGRRGDMIKILWHDGLGLSLYAKRLERGHFVWPAASTGSSRSQPRSSATCSTGSTGVTRFTHSARNVRDSCCLVHFLRAAIVRPWFHSCMEFASRRDCNTESRAGSRPCQDRRRRGDDRTPEPRDREAQAPDLRTALGAKCTLTSLHTQAGVTYDRPKLAEPTGIGDEYVISHLRHIDGWELRSRCHCRAPDQLLRPRQFWRHDQL